MKNAQKPDHVSLNTVISRLKEGRYVIPDFQREFEWKPWDINDLMRSIFRDYYIGSLLLWKGKKENFDALACEPIYGYSGNNGSAEHIVLDGQQRLTAMYYTFIAPNTPLPSRKNRYIYFLRIDQFMEDSDDAAFEYDWTRRGPQLLKNKSAQYEQHYFPLATVGEGGWNIFSWIQGYESHWEEKRDTAAAEGDETAAEIASQHVENARTFGNHIKEVTEQYQITYIELDRDLEVEKVCDIFTQINSKGVQLDVFDLINALLKPKGLQLKHLWRKAAKRLEFVETSKMNVYILQVMSILCQSYCSPKYLYYLLPGQKKQIRDSEGKLVKEILIADTADFEKRWNAAVSALEFAIKLLRHPQEFGAISSRYLPYVSILPVFAALHHHGSRLSASEKLSAQRKIHQWYWASVFINRYSGSVESTSARDFIDVKGWIADSEAEPAMIHEFKVRFRGLELRKETQRGTSVYNGIFNLLILSGAKDWMTGNVPQHDELDDHHIVPKSWGRDNLKRKEVDTILNRTPLTAETNRYIINNRLPNEYLPELIEKNGEKVIRSILDSHFISRKALEILIRDPFSPDDFEEFITERERTIQTAIEDFLVKERVDLPPQLRELDAQIEQVELRLRAEVERSLKGDKELVPRHIADKVDERLQQAVKKNAALDSEHYETLHGQLEFFDLREVQDAIMNKALWPRFESLFGSKGMLETKFGQFAELRNGIRHSRSVDEVTRKEGEAAILWFEKVLST